MISGPERVQEGQDHLHRAAEMDLFPVQGVVDEIVVPGYHIEKPPAVPDKPGAHPSGVVVGGDEAQVPADELLVLGETHLLHRIVFHSDTPHG
ncbi:hypothetical protein SDC9_163341 [bioreactor metagenome]|uniref:Uncharacterized protein n=1 Tax=bioreactor metagenome TaxID=1076179 RepID=A0A645FVE4_9ZZZZ